MNQPKEPGEYKTREGKRENMKRKIGKEMFT